MRHTTTNFYVPPEAIRRGIVHFPEDESNHLARVLRARTGDEVRVINGIGSAYRVKITRSDPAHSRGEIIGESEAVKEPHVKYTIGIGTIQPKRLESAWDACIQLGISRLIPVKTVYATERIKPDGKYMKRLQAVSVRAMKQSGRVVLPEVQSPMAIGELLVSGEFENILYGDPEGLPAPPGEISELTESVLLIVGPEGGFSAAEKRMISEVKGIPISLGRRRLRTETAAIALAVIALRWTGDM